VPERDRIAGRTRVGQGREAEIFAWDDDTVLRLLRADGDLQRVRREEAAMRFAADGGVDVPRVHGTQLEDGRAGLIMDRVDGPDLITLMGKRPWAVPRVARIVGQAHARMHEVVAPTDLPPLRGVARAKIERARDLPAELATLALRTLESLPDGDRLCHGDFHLGNVLLGRQGPAVIDWTDATRGDPAGDIARSCVLLRVAAVQEHMPSLLQRLQTRGRGAFVRLYLRAYRRIRPIDAALVARWEFVRAADRVFEGVEGERAALFELLERRASEVT
jgi:aminoglycoside phosphotransferase (APT) family kinase protein